MRVKTQSLPYSEEAIVVETCVKSVQSNSDNGQYKISRENVCFFKQED